MLPSPPSNYQRLFELLLSLTLLFPALTYANNKYTDTILLKNGAAVPCIIKNITDEQLSIEYQAPTGTGTLQRQVPWKDIQHVTFAIEQTFSPLLKTTPTSLNSLPTLAHHWQQHQHLLKFPNHPIGALGVHYIKTLLLSQDTQHLHLALEIINQIHTHDWQQQRRQQATILKLQTLYALQHSQELRDAAKQLLEQPNLTPENAADIHLILAKLDHLELSQLESEHPRWNDDDLVRPLRDDLYHRLIDHCLIPSLFYGTCEPQAADGLALALNTFADHQQTIAAAAIARDLLILYPNSSHSTLASNFLERHQLPILPPKPGEDTPTNTTSKSPPTEEITRRKRYEKTQKN